VIGDGNVPENIADSAFNLTDELTILGFKIENGDNNFRNNGNRILERIKKQVRIWSRYNLSLPGRIEISKTMLYSQLNYMGCIIPIPGDILEKIENEIGNFANGNLRLAKHRVFGKVEDGGLGLFNIKNFLAAQACS
jgi:hypothetical protein